MRETRSRTSSGPRRFMGGAAISVNRTAPSLRTVSVSKTMERSSAAARHGDDACATTELSVSGMVMVWPLLGDEKRKRLNASAAAVEATSLLVGYRAVHRRFAKVMFVPSSAHLTSVTSGLPFSTTYVAS